MRSGKRSFDTSGSGHLVPDESLVGVVDETAHRGIDSEGLDNSKLRRVTRSGQQSWTQNFLRSLRNRSGGRRSWFGGGHMMRSGKRSSWGGDKED